MKCSKCGTEYKGNFCPKCGTPSLSQVPSQQPTGYPVNFAQPAYNPQKPKKIKWWQVILIVLGAVVLLGIVGSIFGKDESGNASDAGTSSISSENSLSTVEEADNPLSMSEIDEMYANPKNFKGRNVVLYGKIFIDPKKDGDTVYFQMYADPDELGRNTVVGYKNQNVDLKSGDYVKIIGTVSSEFKGSNLFGAALSAPKIIATNVEVVNYITAVRPTIKSADINKTIDQSGYKFTIKKVEFSEKETRVYISFENSGKEEFTFYKYSSKIVQNGKQFDTEHNYWAEYPDLQTEILTGVVTDGILTFGKMEPSSFQLYLDGSSNDYSEDINEYVFDVTIG